MNATLQVRGMEIKERGLSEQVVDCFFNGFGVVLSRKVGKGGLGSPRPPQLLDQHKCLCNQD